MFANRNVYITNFKYILIAKSLAPAMHVTVKDWCKAIYIHLSEISEFIQDLTLEMYRIVVI